MTQKSIQFKNCTEKYWQNTTVYHVENNFLAETCSAVFFIKT